MKPSSAVLIISLAANGALAGSAVWVATHPAFSAQIKAWLGPAPKTAPTAAAVKPASGPAANNAQWAQFQTDDLKSLVARLKSAGFPAEVIRAIVATRVQAQFAPRWHELIEKNPPKPYWKKGGNFATDAKFSMALRALNKEQSAAVKDLVGNNPDDVGNLMQSRQEQARYGNLSPESAEKVRRISSDYDDLKQAIYMGTIGGTMLPSDSKQLQYLQQQETDDLTKAMSPAEYADYQLRSSPLANQVRNSLGAFEPTEDEYKTIFGIEQAIKGSTTTNPAGLSAADRQAQQTEIQQQLETALGPDRFADYTRASNPAYSAAYQIAQRLNLPAEAPAQVYALQQQFTQQANAIKADTSLSAADRSSQLAAVSQQATSQVTAILGADGTAGYLRGGGNWVRNLKNNGSRNTVVTPTLIGP